MASASPPVSPEKPASPVTPPSEAAAPDFSALKQLLSSKQSGIKQLLHELRYTVESEIELPWIVAGGNQSCGKSSVLEAISRLDFPRSQRTCTKFATELSLCGKPGQDGTAVSMNIRWSDKTNGATNISNPTTLENLAREINSAYEAMKEHNNSQNLSFFKDVLCIQASHADFPDFTLIDLPGIIHNQSKEGDESMVLDILHSYLRQEKTIILAVVEAECDPDVQRILSLAKDYDPRGERTMGIITKPDRVEGFELRDHWIQIASGQNPNYQFKYGWHVVRNRGPEDMALSFSERDRQEENFFKNSPWSQLGHDRLGVEALRTRLSQISESHTRDALPGVYGQLTQKYDDCCTELDQLGLLRDSEQNRVGYLTEISSRFGRTTSDAIAGLSDFPLFGDDERTFCALLYERYESFDRMMRQCGHTIEISDGRSKSYQQTTVLPQVPNLSQPWPLPEPKTTKELLDWIKDTCYKRRGRELEIPDPKNINRLFRAQSKKWRMIAEYYLNSVLEITQDLLEKAAYSSVKEVEKHTAKNLVDNLIQQELVARKEKVCRKLDELLRPYEKYWAISTQSRLQTDFEIWKRSAGSEEMMELAEHILGDYARDQPEERQKQLRLIIDQLSTFERKAQVNALGSSNLWRLTELYYKRALSTFIDSVILFAIEGTILFDLANIFSPDRVQQMNKDPKEKWLIQALTNEPDAVVRRRDNLSEKKGWLHDAREKFPELLGEVEFNALKSKLPRTSHQMPQSQVELSRGLLSNAEHGMSHRAERRPSISISRPSSAASNLFATSAFSENTGLAVPSQDRSPRNGSRGRRSRS